MRRPGSILAMALMASPAMASDPAYDSAVEAVQLRMDEIDRQEGRIPGRVLVFAKAGEEPIVDARGVRNIERGDPVNADTPFYVASMTKAFVGLMAIRLDRQGIMPLDMTLAEAYPDMKVQGVDLAKVTMRMALSHQLGFYSGPLSLRTAYTDRVPVADYGQVVSNAHEPADAAFNYSNNGYILYAGALEKHTGRSWKAWLDEMVLMPLGMRNSSARTSDLPNAANTHEIYESGWRVYAPKTDEIMHAAGGMFVSGSDMGKWLLANAGADSAIPADVLDAAHTPVSAPERSKGPIRCTGYAFGWAVCEAAGVRFLEHGGSYVGTRSEMIVLPDQGVGFAAMFNSDSMTGGLGEQLSLSFILAYAGQTEQLPPPDAFGATYAQMADRYRVNRSKQEVAIVPGEWAPDTAALASYSGRYAHPALGELRLVGDGGRLVGWLNGTELEFIPQARHQFMARLRTDNEYLPFTLVAGEDGRFLEVTWDGSIFTRR